MEQFSHHQTANVPLKLWDSAGPFEAGAMQQLRNVASLPFVFHHVAGMPDVHWGKGATVGSVIATKQAIVPAAVGVDIGCGMMAVRTSLTAKDLPDSLSAIRAEIERAVPKGMESSPGSNHAKGGWSITPNAIARAWYDRFEARWRSIVDKHPKVDGKTSDQLGSMGGGNHFIEICLDEEDRVWAMLHSGSRGTGNRIGVYFIDVAKEAIAKERIDFFMPDKDLAYLAEGTSAVRRLYRGDDLRAGLRDGEPRADDGARARGFAPACPGLQDRQARHQLPPQLCDPRDSFRGAGVGHPQGRGACPGRRSGDHPRIDGHGQLHRRGPRKRGKLLLLLARRGRVMSRAQAKKLISLEQHQAAMHGIEARLDEGVLDESPAAYKDIGAVMEAQQDLVRIRHRLRQVVNIQGLREAGVSVRSAGLSSSVTLPVFQDPARHRRSRLEEGWMLKHVQHDGMPYS